MELKILDFDFSVCKVKDYSKVNFESGFCFTGKTDEENSLVCITQDVPENVTQRDDGWKALKILGVLDFSLTGILSKISTVLANGGIGIFAISTFNTDYVLVKSENLSKAVSLLSNAGYKIV